MHQLQLIVICNKLDSKDEALYTNSESQMLTVSIIPLKFCELKNKFRCHATLRRAMIQRMNMKSIIFMAFTEKYIRIIQEMNKKKCFLFVS